MPRYGLRIWKFPARKTHFEACGQAVAGAVRLCRLHTKSSFFMRKFLVILAGLFLIVVSMSAASESRFFVRILPDRENLYAGDSMLVSVVLYASAPIAEAECVNDFKVGGDKCGVRALPIRREATAGRVREDGNLYYTLVWAQYVVSPQKVGSYKVPPLKFKATLRQIVRMPDWFDQMMGAQPEYRDLKADAKSSVFTFEVKEKPLRSTREMMRSGHVL